MKILRRVAALLALTSPVRGTRQPAPHGQGTEQGRPQVAQLLVDVDRSVRKEGADAEIVFATLLTYDQQLEASLKKEMNMMSATVDKLKVMRNSYVKELNASKTQLRNLGMTAQGSKDMASKYRAGTASTSRKFESVLSSVKGLITTLQGAAITPAGGLVTQAGARSSSEDMYGRIRKLLTTNKMIQPQFPDVFNTFILGQSNADPSHIKMNPALLGRTIDALKKIEARLQSRKSQALIQLTSWERKLTVRALSADASADEQQGVQAEKEEKVEELSFSSTFTQAVLQIDQNFYAKVHDSMKRKADMIDGIRRARQGQGKTLNDLIDLLDGRYTVEDHLAPLKPYGFLQRSSKKRPHQISNLQFEIETALHNHADTHGILMRVKAMLDETKFDVGSLQDVESDMEDVLTTVNYEQSRADDAKQKCESQKLHALQEDRGLNANLNLMTSVRNDTKRAIKSARANLRGIKAKTQALEHLSKDFSHTVTQAMQKLEGQSRDRGMIITAVQMATEIAEGKAGHDGAASWTTAQKSASAALLQEMRTCLQQQELVEKQYRQEEASFRANFVAYVGEYLQLLKERRAHYDSALSALELYSTEVAADASQQSDSVTEGFQLQKESDDLCHSILQFYEHHSKRRQDLSDALHKVLPKVPDVLSRTGDTTQDGDGWLDGQ